MKCILGAFCTTLAVVAITFCSSTGQGQPPAKDAAPNQTHTLKATGSGTAKVSADAAKIAFKVEASGGDMKSAREHLDKQTEKLKDALNALKLDLEIRALPVEVRQQNNQFGIPGPFAPPGGFGQPGGGGFPAPAIPAPGAAPLPPPVNPKPGDVFMLVQAPAPQPAVPALPPLQPLPGAQNGFQPFRANRGFQLSQAFLVTIKNNDTAKLLDAINKTIFTASENGIVLANANPNNNFGVFAQGNQQGPQGPTVQFLRLGETDARRIALERAVADATANVKAAAKAAEVKVADIVSISDQSTTTVDNSTGELEITVKATVTCGIN